MKKRIWAVCLAALLFPTAAHAVELQPAPAAGSSDEQQAQALSDQAYEAYEKGDFPKAIEQYLASYKLVPTADILYNVASIYDKKVNDPKLAVEYYRRYNAAPDAKPDLVGKATARIAALNAGTGGAANTTTGGTGDKDSASEKADSGKTLRTVGIITGLVGVVGLGVGSVTGLIASSKHDDSKCSNNRCPDENAKNTESDAATMATVSTVTFIAGGALLATGVVLYLVAPKSAEKKSAFILPAVAPGGAGYGIRF